MFLLLNILGSISVFLFAAISVDHYFIKVPWGCPYVPITHLHNFIGISFSCLFCCCCFFTCAWFVILYTSSHTFHVISLNHVINMTNLLALTSDIQVNINITLLIGDWCRVLCQGMFLTTGYNRVTLPARNSGYVTCKKPWLCYLWQIWLCCLVGPDWVLCFKGWWYIEVHLEFWWCLLLMVTTVLFWFCVVMVALLLYLVSHLCFLVPNILVNLNVMCLPKQNKKCYKNDC